MFQFPSAPAWMLVLSALTLSPAASGADDELPGWYQWYSKTGKLMRIDAEAQRDADMSSSERVGNWAPRLLEQPSPDVALPDQTGARVPLRAHVGKRFAVIQPFQSWW